MIKYILPYIFALSALPFILVGCSDGDDYNYPPVRLELVDLFFDAEGGVDYVVLNNNRQYTPQYRYGLLSETPDNSIRGLSHLQFDESGNNLVRMYNFAPVAVLDASRIYNVEDDGTIIDVSRVWVSNDKYINIDLKVPEIDGEQHLGESLMRSIHTLGIKVLERSEKSASIELMHNSESSSVVGNREQLLFSINLDALIADDSDKFTVKLIIPLADGSHFEKILRIIDRDEA